MVNTFSNNKLRLPKGFQSLLVGLSTEILRHQPRNIHEFAADYFEKLLQRREQGEESYAADEQRSRDQQNNHHTFEEEFPVDDPNIQHAATKIQAQFRGFKTRRELEKMKDKPDEITHSNHQESNYDHEQLRTSNDEYKKSSDTSNEQEDDYDFDEPITEEEKLEQERAAISIQAQFRGYKARKHLREVTDDSQEKETYNNEDKTSTHLNDHNRNSTLNDKMETNKNDHNQRDSSQLSDDSDNYQQNNEFEIDDMSDPNLDKAATRIQASFRGYKTRKELGTGTGVSTSDHPSSNSSQTHDEYDNERNKNILSPSAESNKVPIGEEEDDAAAAVKIQAAYRGYRVRKDLDK